MSRWLTLILFLVVSSSTWAAEPGSSAHRSDAADLSFINYFNDLNAMDEMTCQPRCHGQSFCGGLPDMDLCLHPDLENACTWTCDEP